MSTKKERGEFYCTTRWRRLRLAALNASGFVCEACGSGYPLEVHHRKPIRQGGAAWTLENLMVLCRPCHRHWHAEHERELRPDGPAWDELLRDLERKEPPCDAV